MGLSLLSIACRCFIIGVAACGGSEGSATSSSVLDGGGADAASAAPAGGSGGGGFIWGGTATMTATLGSSGASSGPGESGGGSSGESVLQSGAPATTSGETGGGSSGLVVTSGVGVSDSASVTPPPGCPGSVPTGACTMPGQACDYQFAGGSGGVYCVCTGTWTCTELLAGCPASPPTIGTPCSHEGLMCDYATCPSPTCTNGAWTPSMTVCGG